MKKKTTFNTFYLGIFPTLLTRLSLVAIIVVISGVTIGVRLKVRPCEKTHEYHFISKWFCITANTGLASTHNEKANDYLNEADAWFQKEEFGKARVQYLNARREDPNNPKVHVGLGNAYLRMGDIDLAEAAYKKAITLDRKIPGAYVGLGFVAYKKAEMDLACEHANTAEKLGFSGAEIYFLNAECQFAHADPTQADDLIQKGLAMEPNQNWPLRYAADLYYRMGKFDKVALLYEKLHTALPHEYQTAVALAGAYRKTNALDKAGSIIDQILKKNPDYAPAMAEKAEIMVSRDELDQAIRTYEQLAEEKTTNPEVTVRLAELYHLEGQADKSLKTAWKILKKYPTHPEANLLAAEIYYERQLYSAAIRYCRQGIEGNPRLDKLYRYLASSLIHIESFTEAEMALDKGLKLSPSDPVLFRMKCLIPWKKGNEDAALACLDHFSESQPDSSLPDLMAAQILTQQNLYPEAIARYERALKKDPSNLHTLNNLAHMQLYYGKNLDRAEELAQRAKQQSPGDPVIADTLGWIYYHRGDFNKAILELSYASQKMAGVPGIRYRLGAAYYRNGQFRQSEKELKSALKYPGYFEGKKDAAALLDKINKEINN